MFYLTNIILLLSIWIIRKTPCIAKLSLRESDSSTGTSSSLNSRVREFVHALSHNLCAVSWSWYGVKGQLHHVSGLSGAVVSYNNA